MPIGIYKHKKGYKLAKKHRKRISQSCKGRIPWNKDIKGAISSGSFKKGHKNSLEVRLKMSLAKKGKTAHNKGKIGLYKQSEKSKNKIRKWQINNPNRKFKDTGIELKIEAELQRRNINYQKQVPLCKVAIVDFYLPEYRIVIQCDGDYWHNKKGAKERDERQDKVLTFNGFNVYRFWGHEINQSTEDCINKIKL